VKPHVAVLLEASVAVHVTFVVPVGKQEPEGGLQSTVTPGQLSVAVTVKFTSWQEGAGHAFWSVNAVTFAGQVITGGWVSTTVTVNVQLDMLFAASLTEHVTVVAPSWKVEPEAGLHEGAPTPAQLSLTVGFG
jgi:hypothetical protein